MSTQQQDTPGRTPPARRAEVVDNVCDAFETAWRAGQRPKIEDYLGEADERLRGQLLEELLLSELRLHIGNGITPDRDQYFRRFPGCAELIDRTIDQAAKASTAPSRHGTTSRSGEAGSGRGLSVRCPHCHNPIEIVVDARLDDITCSTCGSHFSLVQDETTTRDASKVTTVGHFELIERLGLGGFGTVWKARDTQLDRSVAVKIPRHGQLEPSEAEKFLREARAIAQLNHPNIVRVYEVGRDGDSVYIVSDLVRGVSLADRLTAGPPTAREAAELCARIADALAHAHEAGIVHRDLKPQNIMIDTKGEPILMDFGLARRDVGEVTVTVDGQLLGTPAYMSPEQARGEAHQADHRTDLYSLGVILFELLTGERPFRGNARMLIHQVIHDEPPSPRRLNSSVPKDLETICLKCLEKDPANRYGSANDISDELRRFLRDEPIHARPISAWQRSWRWCRRNPVVSALAGTVVLSLLMGVGISSYYAILANTRALDANTQRQDAEHARAS